MKRYYLYIVLTRTNTAISKIIHFIKKDQYTHASISLDIELNQMFSFGRRWTYNPFIGRFRKENINEGVFKFCNTLPGAVIEIAVSKQQYEKAQELIEHFNGNRHRYKYNYRGLIDCIMNRAYYSNDRFLCSEFVYYILKECGITDFNIARNLVRPQSLYSIDGKIIYEGDLKIFKQQQDLKFAKFNLSSI